MSLILINGISTSGKSSIARELKKRGYKACDLERLPSSGWYNKQTGVYAAPFGKGGKTPDWLNQHEWRVSIQEIKSIQKAAGDKLVFLCGGAANEAQLYKLCDKSIWLKTDEVTIRSRVAIPREHSFGTKPHELKVILDSNNTKEQLVKKWGSVIIDARQPLSDVVDNIIEAVEYTR